MAKEKTEKEKKRKPKQRGNGEGSIYKRSDGRWCAAITVGRTTEGKLKKKVLYGKTRNEVSDKMNKELNALSIGNFVDANNITLKEWMNTWLFEYKKSSIRAISFGCYVGSANKHIIPKLGHIKLKDLKPFMIQRFYNDLSKEIASSTIKFVHMLLSESLKQAVKNNLISKNVASSDFVTLPRVKGSDARPLTVEEQEKFLKAIGEDRLKALYILTLGSGMRRSEILGLKWSNTNLDEGIITVKDAAKRIKINFEKDAAVKTKIVVEEPKSKSGNRTIPIPQNVVNELKQHKVRQDEEKKIAGGLYKDNELVFCNALGKIIPESTLHDNYKRILKAIDLKGITFHSLRHTYATRLLEQNEHPKIVQELLGHSKVSLTLDTYSHVMPVMKVKAAESINHLFDQKNVESYDKNE